MKLDLIRDKSAEEIENGEGLCTVRVAQGTLFTISDWVLHLANFFR